MYLPSLHPHLPLLSLFSLFLLLALPTTSSPLPQPPSILDLRIEQCPVQRPTCHANCQKQRVALDYCFCNLNCLGTHGKYGYYDRVGMYVSMILL